MENTIENKAKFFAQYWGQEVAEQCEGGGSGFKYEINEATLIKSEIRYDQLLLKSLSSITDEDAMKIASIQGVSFMLDTDEAYLAEMTHTGKRLVDDYDNGDDWELTLRSFDYLRSRGYAIPYMDLSVEKLIEYGWVKLTAYPPNKSRM